jgi:hypothetical protein
MTDPDKTLKVTPRTPGVHRAYCNEISEGSLS